MAKKLIDLMKLKPESEARTETGNEIAVIGIGLDFPRAGDARAFWEQLAGGVGATGNLPYSRRMEAERYARFKQMDKSEWQFIKQGYLRSIDRFDYRFFGLSPREAELMDPHQRLFLQTAWHAFEDAGYDDKRLKGSRTGVFVGYDHEAYSYTSRVLEVAPAAYKEAHVGNLVSMIPGRVSYHFDLKGPGMIVNTSCSSSLVAVHAAVRSILRGECEMALAGGVRLDILPVDLTGKVGIESSSGQTRTFDDRADGTVTGEGVCAVVLKPLRQALENRDPVYAVIKGSAINQDGHSIGLTAPNVLAQEEVLVEAWRDAGVDPETIAYLEAHGTGTKLGDPIEIEAIGKAFARFTGRKQFCAIGSVKPNIGHLIGAAGLAGFVRAVYALYLRRLPPTLHFTRPNRSIAFQESPVYVNDILREWTSDGTPRRCGVSSFGFSGTNCHIVLEEAPESAPSPLSAPALQTHALALSAKSPAVLRQRAGQMASWLSQPRPEKLGDICFTANAARSHFTCRLVVAGRSRREIADALNALQESDFQTIVPGAGLARGADLPEDAGVMRRLCAAYARGEEADWRELYAEDAHERVRLPLYPFEQLRCWIDSPLAAPLPFWEPGWEQAPSDAQARPPVRKRCLAVHDGGAAAAKLADAIRAGADSLVEVLPGSEFGRESASVFRLDFAAPAIAPDYGALFAAVDPGELDQIVFVHGLEPPDPRPAANRLEASVNEGLFHLIGLCKALAGHRGLGPELVVVTAHSYAISGREGGLLPGNRLLHTLGTTLPLESPNLRIRIVDADALTSPDALAGELAAAAEADAPKIVALRGGERYVRVCRIAKDAPSGELPLRAGGTYVITGGGGGIGQEIAQFLADQKPLHIAVISRLSAPDAQTLDDIRGAGSTVSVHYADAGSRDELQAALADIRSGFGPIRGVIHCAGVTPQQGALFDKQRGVIRAALAAKLFGTMHLDELTQEDPLDFFICSSSISALVGLPGEIEYSMSNAFLDAFCEERNLRLGGTKCINWPAWNETGMAVLSGSDLSGGVLDSVSSAEGMEAFERFLRSGLSRAIIGKPARGGQRFALLITGRIGIADYYDRREESRESAASDSFAATDDKPQIVLHGHDAGYTPTERQIAQIWQEVLGYSSFHVEDQFFDIGGNSIMIMKVLSLVEGHFPGTVQLSDLFAFPTIAKLARLIDENRRPTGNARLQENAGGVNSGDGDDGEEHIEELIDRLTSGKVTVSKAMSYLTDEGTGEGNG